jgi:hypothetical protein
LPADDSGICLTAHALTIANPAMRRLAAKINLRIGIATSPDDLTTARSPRLLDRRPYQGPVMAIGLKSAGSPAP